MNQSSNDIFKAIKDYDLEKVKSCIASGADVNAPCAKGENKGAPPLLTAVLSNSWKSCEIIKELIKAGANINYVDDLKNVGFTLLHHAANLGIVPGTWTLLVSGANPSVKDTKLGRTPLHYAGMKGQTQIFELLVLAGGNPTAGADGGGGHTGETYAAMKYGVETGEDFHVVTLDYSNNKKLFQFFKVIVKGDEKVFNDLFPKFVTARASETGWTALMVAAIAGRKEMAEKIIEKGAKLNVADRRGATALHHAVQYGNGDISEMLIVKGADVNAKDTIGNTALVDVLMTSQNESIAKQLIARGANVNSQNNYGETPLYTSAQGRNIELVKLLLDAGADPKIRTTDGGSVLHSAARTKNPEIIRELVKRGADLHATMNDGWQPIHVTAEAGNLDTLKAMLELGADKEAKTKDGKTVLDIATEGGFDKLVAVLKGKKRKSR